MAVTATRRKKETVQTLNANAGVGGTRIAEDKYIAMRRALMRVIPRGETGVLAKDLPELVRPRLPKDVYAPSVSVPWYTVTVKLDLEARGLIERVPHVRPQRVRRTEVR